MAGNPKPGSASNASARKPFIAVALLAMAVAVGVLTIKATSDRHQSEPHPAAGGNSASANRPSLAQEVCENSRRLMDGRVYAPARDLMLKYVAANRRDIEVRPLLAEAQIALGELDHAQRTLVDLLRLAPDMAQANYLMSRVLKLRHDEKYLDFLKRAADCEDAKTEMQSQYGRELLARQDLAGAAEYLQVAYERDERGAATLAAMGELAMKQGDLATAVSMFKSSLVAQPRSPRTWELLAQTLRASGQIAQGDKAVKDGLKHQPSGWLLMESGRMLLESNELAAAAAAFEQASAYKGFDIAAHVQAAQAYLQLGQYAQAMSSIDQALEQPGTAESLTGLAVWNATSLDSPLREILALQTLSLFDLKAKIEDLRFGKAGR